MLEVLRSLACRMMEGRGAVSHRSEPPPAQPLADTSWYAELEQLVQRHELGELTDEQFAQAKRRILAAARRPTQPEGAQVDERSDPDAEQ